MRTSASLQLLLTVSLHHNIMSNRTTIIFFFALTVSVWAKTYSIPEEQPIARISIPDSWTTEEREEYIDSTMPNKAGHILVMAGEGQKVGESLLEAMRYIRRNGTIRVDARSEKKDTINLRERSMRTLSWTATEKNHPIVIQCNVISDLKGKRLLVVFWGPAEGEKKHRQDLKRILHSVEAP